jgi:hypothetical protein
LFGEDYGIVPWSPYVIWEADLNRQALLDTWLAAIAHLDKPSKTIVFDRIPLPPAILPPLQWDNVDSENLEDGKWPEWPNEGSGDTPA